jgi:hypothetical protein
MTPPYTDPQTVAARLRGRAERSAAAQKPTEPPAAEPAPPNAPSQGLAVARALLVTALAIGGLWAQIFFAKSWLTWSVAKDIKEAQILLQGTFWCTAALLLTLTIEGLRKLASLLASHDFTAGTPESVKPNGREPSALPNPIKILGIQGAGAFLPQLAVVVIAGFGAYQSIHFPKPTTGGKPTPCPAPASSAPLGNHVQFNITSAPASAPTGSGLKGDLTPLIELQERIQSQWHENLKQLVDHNKVQSTETARYFQQAASSVELAASQSASLAASTQTLAAKTTEVSGATHVIAREVLPRVSTLMLANSEEMRTLSAGVVHSFGGEMSAPRSRPLSLPDVLKCNQVASPQGLGEQNLLLTYQCPVLTP